MYLGFYKFDKMVSRIIWGKQRKTTNYGNQNKTVLSKNHKNNTDSSVSVVFNFKQIDQLYHVDTQ